MRAYLAIIKARLLILFQYRSAALAGLTTQVFWGLIKSMILQAFYNSQVGLQGTEPISLAQALAFVWIGQALLQLLTWRLDPEVEAQVKTGNVAYELVRPIDLYWLWFARGIAMRVVPTLMRCLPVFAIAALFFDLPAPMTLWAGLTFIISVGLAFFLSSAITTLVIVSLFWTLSGEGIKRMLPAISVLFSGLVVPLPLFPNWMQPFLNIQPLRGLIDIPCRLYTGVIPVDEAFYYIGFQLFWTVVLIFCGRQLLHKAIQRVEIMGG